MNIDKLGWVVAAGMVGAMFGMGFQASAPKFATVDMAKVFSDSDFASKGTSQLQEFAKPRIAVLQFIRQNLPMSPDDARHYPDLCLKSPRTAADDVEIKRIEADAAAATQKQRDLVQKPGPTAEDQKQMQDLSARANQNQAFGQGLEEKLGQEIDAKKADLREKAMEQVRKTVGDVAHKQGYTIVFSVDSAPYAVNDITADALKEAKQ